MEFAPDFIIKRKRKRSRMAVDPCLGFYRASPEWVPAPNVELTSVPEPFAPTIQQEFGAEGPNDKVNYSTSQAGSLEDCHISTKVESHPQNYDRDQEQVSTPHRSTEYNITVEDFLKMSVASPVKRYGKKKNRRMVNLGASWQEQICDSKDEDSCPRNVKRRRIISSPASADASQPNVESATKSKPRKKLRRTRRTKAHPSLASRLLTAAILAHVDPLPIENEETATHTITRRPIKFTSDALLTSPMSPHQRTRAKFIDPRHATPFPGSADAFSLQNKLVSPDISCTIRKRITDWNPAPAQGASVTKIKRFERTSPTFVVSGRNVSIPLQFVSLQEHEDMLTVKQSFKRQVTSFTENAQHASSAYQTFLSECRPLSLHAIDITQNTRRMAPENSSCPLVLVPSSPYNSEMLSISSPSGLSTSSNSVIPASVSQSLKNLRASITTTAVPITSTCDGSETGCLSSIAFASRSSSRLDLAQPSTPAADLGLAMGGCNRSHVSARKYIHAGSGRADSIQLSAAGQPLKPLASFLNLFLENARNTTKLQEATAAVHSSGNVLSSRSSAERKFTHASRNISSPSTQVSSDVYRSKIYTRLDTSTGSSVHTTHRSDLFNHPNSSNNHIPSNRIRQSSNCSTHRSIIGGINKPSSAGNQVLLSDSFSRAQTRSSSRKALVSGNEVHRQRSFVDPLVDMKYTKYLLIPTARSEVEIEANAMNERNQETIVPAPTSSPNPFAVFAPTPESSQILEGLSSSPQDFITYPSSSMALPLSSVQLSDLIGEVEDEGHNVLSKSINFFGAFSV